MKKDSQELADALDVMLAFQNGEDVDVRWRGVYCDEADWKPSAWLATPDPAFNWWSFEYRVSVQGEQ